MFPAARKLGVAQSGRLGLACRAVRGRGGSASEPRQALIGATVVCPDLPRIPWQQSFPRESAERNALHTDWRATSNSVHLTGGQASHLSWPTGFQPVVSVADRRDALSSLTGWKPVLLPKGAKWTVLRATSQTLAHDGLKPMFRGKKNGNHDTYFFFPEVLGKDLLFPPNMRKKKRYLQGIRRMRGKPLTNPCFFISHLNAGCGRTTLIQLPTAFDPYTFTYSGSSGCWLGAVVPAD